MSMEIQSSLVFQQYAMAMVGMSPDTIVSVRNMAISMRDSFGLAEPRDPSSLGGIIPPQLMLPKSPSLGMIDLSQSMVKIENLLININMGGVQFSSVNFRAGLHMIDRMVGVIQEQIMLQMSVSFQIFASPQKTIDPFGIGGMGEGSKHKSNLANSNEVVLALHQILEKNKGKLMKMEDVQKKLLEDYGIKAEVTEIKGRKALKFENGDFIVDSNGNGGLDMSDYKFKEAIKAIEEKYGITPETFDKMAELDKKIRGVIETLQKNFGDFMKYLDIFQYDRELMYTAGNIFNQAYALAE